jgi:TonB-dependent receptor
VTANGNLGVRVVKTKIDGKGRLVLSTATNSYILDEEPALDGDYYEPLPAFNFILAPNNSKNVLFRGAITRALTRPTISELNPTQSINAEDQEISRGNPDLDPFLAWQYDFGVEYYFGKSNEGLFAINGFVKDVDNFIVPSNTTLTMAFPDQGVPSQTYTVSSYRNGGTASIQGFELNFQTPFTFLPGLLSNLGVAANYTYTDTEFTDAFGFSYTFPGASSDTYNFVIYYEQGGFSTRLAYNFRNDYLIAPANDPDGSNALYGEGGGRLDLSLRYRFKNGVRISIDALNLTEEQSYKYYDITQRYQNFEFEGTIYAASIAYSF